jgi:hypothetical protein
MDPHVHLQVVFAFKFGRALITNEVLVVRVHQHVTTQLGFDVKTLGTVGAQVVAGNALMSLLMAPEVVQVVGGVTALFAMELANILVVVDDVLVQHFAVGAQELWAVGTAVDFLVGSSEVLGSHVYLEVLLTVGLEGAPLAGVLALSEVLGLAVEYQFQV